MVRPLGSLALVLGGIAWAAFGLVLAGRTYGDTATLRLLRPAEPLSSTFRSAGDVAPLLVAAVVLTLLGLALLYGRAAWAAGSSGKASVVLLALSVFLAGPWPLVLVGFLGIFLGMLALAVTALRTGVLPRSAAGMIIAAAVLLLFFNTEDDRALLAIAPGVAWFTLGARSFTWARAGT